jgi:hypothetical protein
MTSSASSGRHVPFAPSPSVPLAMTAVGRATAADGVPLARSGPGSASGQRARHPLATRHLSGLAGYQVMMICPLPLLMPTPLPATSTWNTCPEVRLDKIPSAWPPLPPGRPVISPAGEPPCAASPAMNALWTPSRGLADDYRGCSRAEVGTRLCGRGHRESTQVIIQTPDNATQGHR